MKRSEFITLLGGALAWPIAARAQQPKRVIGYLASAPADPGLTQFRQALKETGYADGENVVIEVHSADGQYERLPAFATDLVARNVTIIVAASGPSARAARSATTTIPILFMSGADPVTYGMVESLNRPGGNATGIYLPYTQLESKRLELLHSLVPNASVIGVLLNPTVPTAKQQLNDAQEAARALGVELRVVFASSENDIANAFASFSEQHLAAVSVGADPFFLGRCDQLVAVAARYTLPAMHPFHECAIAGGLMSYAPSRAEAVRSIAAYAARVLKGERPANLPVQQSTKVELILNLKTAKAMGLDIPPNLLALADEVIE